MPTKSAPTRKKQPAGPWTCPKCGRQFVSRNKQHSCGRYQLSDHFLNKDPQVRKLFDHLFKALRAFGTVTAHAVKTRIVLQGETQFAAVAPRKHWLEGYLWLGRRAAHRTIYKVEMGVFRDYGHLFRLTKPEDLDDDLTALLHEAYMIARQSLTNRR
jgi:hypothetical protein